MARLNKSTDDEAQVEAMLGKLAASPARDAQVARDGRTRFLAQAQEIAPAVSTGEKRRHTGWNKIFSLRSNAAMKPKTLLSILSALVLVALVAVFMANNVTTVSAQQVLERATAAQTARTAGQGIHHYRYELYENPQAAADGGATTIFEGYYDISQGFARGVTVDAAGKIVELYANDGQFSYDSQRDAQGKIINPLVLMRAPVSPEKRSVGQQANMVDTNKALFDDFRSNPRVAMAGKQTLPDGRQVYVLVNKNYQSQQQGAKTYTGSMSMTFDTQTYALVESKITTRKDNQDVVIDAVKYLVDEILPASSPITWDLSDVQGISFVDDAAPAEGKVTFDVLTLDELTARAQPYLLKHMPAGYTLELVAAANQPADQPYQYEVNYTGPAGESFGMMAIGATDMTFIKNNFYDGSYKTASGLTLYYSTSGGAKNTNAILATPDGQSFLLGAALPRERVQQLAEDLAPAK